MKKMMTLLIAVLLTSSVFAQDHDHGKHGKHEKGVNGGEVFEVGKGIADLEFVHDEKTGTVKLFLYKDGTKTALKIAKAPRINVTLKNTRKQVKTKAIGGGETASSFIATSDLFKKEFEGVVSIKIAGKSYKVKLKDDHAGHGHGDHEGHDH